MMAFLSASAISVVLLLICVALFYEIMAHVWVLLPRLKGRPRLQILFTVFSTFIGHTGAVWIFGATYYLLDRGFDYGTLKGDDVGHGLLQYVYFSAVAYSSLGLGDVYPTGGLQLLVGVEAIMGLILIGWSVAFTYLVTQEYLVHRGGKDHPLIKK